MAAMLSVPTQAHVFPEPLAQIVSYGGEVQGSVVKEELCTPAAMRKLVLKSM